jgi:hypothetical protein
MATTSSNPGAAKGKPGNQGTVRGKKPLPAPNTKLTKDDYLYALEVAGQPAVTAKDKKMKRQAKADMLYLEQKYPKYTARVKDFGTRKEMPNWGGGNIVSGKTRMGNLGSNRSGMRAK